MVRAFFIVKTKPNLDEAEDYIIVVKYKLRRVINERGTLGIL